MTAPEHVTLSLSHLCSDESGQDLVEYALVAALVGLASVTGIHVVTVSVISTSITAVVNKFTNVVSSAI